MLQCGLATKSTEYPNKIWGLKVNYHENTYVCQSVNVCRGVVNQPEVTSLSGHSPGSQRLNQAGDVTHWHDWPSRMTPLGHLPPLALWTPITLVNVHPGPANIYELTNISLFMVPRKIIKIPQKMVPPPQGSSRGDPAPLAAHFGQSVISGQWFRWSQSWAVMTFRQAVPTSYKCLWHILAVASVHNFIIMLLKFFLNESLYESLAPMFFLEFSRSLFHVRPRRTWWPRGTRKIVNFGHLWHLDQLLDWFNPKWTILWCSGTYRIVYQNFDSTYVPAGKNRETKCLYLYDVGVNRLID